MISQILYRAPTLCCLLFAVACCLPALEFTYTSGPTSPMYGANIILVGWSGIFAGIMAWYANPIWILGVTLAYYRKPIPAAIASLVAIAIAYNTFSVIGRVLPADEGNVTHMTLVRLLPGCYVWFAALLSLPFVALFAKRI